MSLVRLLPLSCFRTSFLASAILLSGVAVDVQGQAGSTRSPSEFAREQVDTELHARRLLDRADLQAEISNLEAEWKQKWPELLPSTRQQAHGALEELAYLVAMETVDSDPRRPRLMQISMPPHKWFGADIPGGRWGIFKVRERLTVILALCGA